MILLRFTENFLLIASADHHLRGWDVKPFLSAVYSIIFFWSNMTSGGLQQVFGYLGKG